jgi:hypothetical protein
LRQACILGFTRDGDHLLGYTHDQGDAGDEDSVGSFALRLWRVSTPTSAAEVFHAPLFRSWTGSPREAYGAGALGRGDGGRHSLLEITVAEDAGQAWFIVVGCEPAGTDDATQTRYCTVVPHPLRVGFSAPSGGDGCWSFSYRVSTPFPAIDLRRWWLSPTRLVINRSDGIDIYLLPDPRRSTHAAGDQSSPGGLRMRVVPGCWVAQPELQSADGATDTARDEAVPGSNECGGGGAFVPDCLVHTSDGDAPDAASIGHVSFEVEPLLSAVAKVQGNRVLDYNLQLLEPLDDCTVSALVVTSSQHPPLHRKPLEEAFLLVLDITSGRCSTLRFNVPPGVPSMLGSSRPWLLQKAQAQLQPLQPATTVACAVWTNHSVVGDGATLLQLAHPTLPLTLNW